MVRPRGTVIQVRSFGRSGVADVLCKFGETEAPGGCRTGRRGGVGAGHETKKVSPRALARRSSAVMRTQAVARPNGHKRQRESYNRAPRVEGIEERKASKLLADYQLLRASSCSVVALLYLQEMCPLGCVLTAPVPLPVPAPLAAIPRPKLAPARLTAKGAIGAGLGNSKETQCTIGGGYGRMNERRS